jgi:hypothetical protein
MKDRIDLGINDKTISLWSYINLPENIVDYINPAYEANNSVLWPSVAPQSIVSSCSLCSVLTDRILITTLNPTDFLDFMGSNVFEMDG